MNPQKIMKVLNKIGAPRANLGYKYLIIAVQKISKNKQLLGEVVHLYKEVADDEESTATRVERAIRHEVELIFLIGNPSDLDEVFGSYRKNGKLANKEFIAALYYYLLYKGEET